MERSLEERGEEMPAVYALPEKDRLRTRAADLLRRQKREMKRRTRVVRVFPDGHVGLRLASALLNEFKSGGGTERKYLNMDAARLDAR
ncbi:MAG: transposase [Acidobacteriota bacterium]